ncbi:MAG: PIG-L family deacetylase [Myxococcota bacterium]
MSVAAPAPQIAVQTQTATSIAQQDFWNSARLFHEINKVDHLPRVLFVAAHPDDENTQLIAYLSAVRRIDIAYLSLTRGSGGQNMIGAEQGDLLGIIRSQELLRARRTDGGRQFFTRARDFGFSKTLDETLKVWGPQEVLGDVVRIIRLFRPDVVITRFPEEGQTHGHHLASARLARLAFAAAADPKQFPEQLESLSVWQAKRLLYNVPNWIGERGGDNQADFSIDVGQFVPTLGLTTAELAAHSRSMHRSQGFGRGAVHGELTESFRNIGGDAAKTDLLEGLPQRLRDVPGGLKASAALERAQKALQPDAPWKAVDSLIAAYHALEDLRDADLRARKKAELTVCLVHALGLHLDLTSPILQGVLGQAVELELSAVNRGPLQVSLTSSNIGGEVRPLNVALPPGKLVQVAVQAKLPTAPMVSTPYWLRQPGGEGIFTITDPEQMAWPIGQAPLSAEVTLGLPQGLSLTVDLTVRHLAVDKVLGERAAPFQVVPAVVLQPTSDVLLLPGKEPQVWWVDVIGKRLGQQTTITLQAPEGWSVQPPAVELMFSQGHERHRIGFEISAPPGAASAQLTPYVQSAVGTTPTPALREDAIDYPHLPPMTVLRPFQLRAAPLQIAPLARRIAYIMGSGDKVPEVLRQLGIPIEELDDATLRSGDLGIYDVIVMGVRALNVREAALNNHERLMNYVAAGGHLVVQYNTNAWYSLLDAPVGPFPLLITRARVTDETAPVEFLLPKHPLVTQPHRLEAADFDGWVQERGLYFAGEWDPRYEVLFSMADAGETAERGSLLVGHHGKGTFIYTGLAFFRQLPAGVPGATRLFLNLLAYPKN